MKKYVVIVHVVKKPDVREPAEPVILRKLHELGFTTVSELEIGTFFKIFLSANTETKADALAKEMGQKLLANPVTDYFKIDNVTAC